MVRVTLPYHLQNLAQVGKEVKVEVAGTVTLASVLDSLESAYPVLKGTIRDHGTMKRRAFLRFFASGEDISMDSTERVLPESVASGKEPLMVVGAIAGG